MKLVCFLSIMTTLAAANNQDADLHEDIDHLKAAQSHAMMQRIKNPAVASRRSPEQSEVRVGTDLNDACTDDLLTEEATEDLASFDTFRLPEVPAVPLKAVLLSSDSLASKQEEMLDASGIFAEVLCLLTAALVIHIVFKLFKVTTKDKRTSPAKDHPVECTLDVNVKAKARSHCTEAACFKAKADCENTDAFGCTALHLAAAHGKVSDVRALLERGYNPNSREAWDETPLHMAARCGSLQVCIQLLNSGAEVNALNASDKTPLYVAAVSKHEAVCEFLLDNGAHAADQDDASLPPMLSALMFQRLLTDLHKESKPSSVE
jgi:hypothetical protein